MYDTVYALQDRRDDMSLKLRGMAVRWGTLTPRYAKRANVCMLLSLLLGGAVFDLNFLYYACAVVHFVLYNSWLRGVRHREAGSYHRFFMRNAATGWLIFAMILIGRIGVEEDRKAVDGNKRSK